ncbi:sn-glycerol-3-phosphate ABC transporter permease UgpE [Serratia ureilytica]
MIENRRGLDIFSHVMLIIGVLVVLFPLYVAFVAATLDDKQVFQVPMTLVPGGHLGKHPQYLAGRRGQPKVPFSLLLLNSVIMALAITFGKIAVSVLSAYAIVYFRFPLQPVLLADFPALMLPVEVRIFPTVEVISNLNLLDSYTGLTLPLMASATATFLLRQFFMTLPDELLEAARIDGAGPMRFFWDIDAAAVENQSGGAVRHHLYLRLEPIPVADPDHQRRLDGYRGGGHQEHDLHLRRADPVEPGDGGDDSDFIATAGGGASERWFVRGLVDSEK